MRTPQFHLLVAGAALLFSLAAGLNGQTTFATITGTATDPTGSAIAGVTVTTTHLESNISTTAQSNEAGVYTIPQLKEGTYTVKANISGRDIAVSLAGPFARERRLERDEPAV